MAPWPFIVVAGGVIGLLMGLFGVGGSSVATPVLSLLGVPGLLAVASPLPATIPTAALAAGPYLQAGEARPRAAAWSLVGRGPSDDHRGTTVARRGRAGAARRVRDRPGRARCSRGAPHRRGHPRGRHPAPPKPSAAGRRDRRSGPVHRAAGQRRWVPAGSALP